MVVGGTAARRVGQDRIGQAGTEYRPPRSVPSVHVPWPRPQANALPRAPHKLREGIPRLPRNTHSRPAPTDPATPHTPFRGSPLESAGLEAAREVDNSSVSTAMAKICSGVGAGGVLGADACLWSLGSAALWRWGPCRTLTAQPAAAARESAVPWCMRRGHDSGVRGGRTMRSRVCGPEGARGMQAPPRSLPGLSALPASRERGLKAKPDPGTGQQRDVPGACC